MEPFKFPQKFYNGREQRAISANSMGLGSTLAGGLSFLSPILGAAGMAGNVLSWILGDDKFDWNKWRDEQADKVSSRYNEGKQEMEKKAYNLADATIGQATNAQGMAGSTAGINSAGTGRLNAQVYSNIAQGRDQTIASATNAMENQKANALAAIDRAAAQGDMAEAFNAPNAITYADNFVKTLQTGPAQDFLGTLFGGGYMGLKSLFSGNNTNNSNLKGNPNTVTGNSKPILPSVDNRQGVIGSGNVTTPDNSWISKAAGIYGSNALPLQDMLLGENNPLANYFGMLSQNSLNPNKLARFARRKEWGY